MSARRRLVLLSAVFCATCGQAPAAGAAGPPVPSSATGLAGVVAPGGSERLITRRAGADTTVSAVRLRDRGVLRSRRIDGRWSMPP